MDKNIASEGEDKVIIIGFGLGYHVEEFLRQYGHTKRLLVVEPEIWLFKKVLEIKTYLLFWSTTLWFCL